MERKKAKDDVAKKAVYYFKKFLRENNFLEVYREYSVAVNSCGLIEAANKYEPVKFIQNSEIFCYWGRIQDEGAKNKCWELSCKWAYVCNEHEIYRSYDGFINYVKAWISYDIGKKIQAINDNKQ